MTLSGFMLCPLPFSVKPASTTSNEVNAWMSWLSEMGDIKHQVILKQVSYDSQLDTQSVLTEYWVQIPRELSIM